MAQAMPRRHCAGRSGGGITEAARWCGWTDRFADRPTPREGASRAPMQKGTPRPRARGPKRSWWRLPASAIAGRREAQRPGQRPDGIDRHSGCLMIAGLLPPSRPALPRDAGSACGPRRRVSSTDSQCRADGGLGHEPNDCSGPRASVPRLKGQAVPGTDSTLRRRPCQARQSFGRAGGRVLPPVHSAQSRTCSARAPSRESCCNEHAIFTVS